MTRPDAIPRPRRGSLTGSLPACTATWTGWQTDARAARDPPALWPEVKSVVVLGAELWRRTTIRWRSWRSASAARSRSMRRPRLSRRHQGQAEALARLARGARPAASVKVFVDTAPVMEKPLAEAAGLGWQGKHTNLVIARVRLLAVPGRDLHHARTAARRAGGRSLRLLPRLPRRLPDRRLPGALPARCAALHLLSHDRAQGPDPARVPRGDRQPHLWLRRLPRGLPVEQVRASRRARRSLSRATISCAPTLAELAALDDAAFRALLRRLADQAHRPRPLRAQRADRDRQFRRRGARRRSRARSRTTPRRWCAAPRSGRCRGSWRRRLCEGRRDPAACRGHASRGRGIGTRPGGRQLVDDPSEPARCPRAAKAMIAVLHQPSSPRRLRKTSDELHGVPPGHVGIDEP